MKTTYQSAYYPTLAASENAWKSIGYSVVGNPQDWPENEVRPDRQSSIPSEIVCLGIGLHGLTDAALYWAACEWQRRKEEQTRSTAIAREAESIGALAKSLCSEADKSVLDRIITKLSERTQYAVRQQLKGTSFLR